MLGVFAGELCWGASSLDLISSDWILIIASLEFSFNTEYIVAPDSMAPSNTEVEFMTILPNEIAIVILLARLD